MKDEIGSLYYQHHCARALVPIGGEHHDFLGETAKERFMYIRKSATLARQFTG
jgi:hypothetical protein